jgi:ribose transport system ATP-binding protein
MGRLSTAERQLVEIARAMAADLKILVMDEPTSALNDAEVKSLIQLMKNLAGQGISIIFISHRLEELFLVADKVMVMRDGRRIGSVDVGKTNQADLVRMMVGREIKDMYPKEAITKGDVVLEVAGLTNKKIKDISFNVRAGEILGMFGLMGAGRTEIARCIFGLDKGYEGEILLNGEKLNIRSPIDAIRANIGYVSEDRRREGIVPLLSLRENITLASLPWLNRRSVIYARKEKEIAEEYIELLDIKTPSMEQKIGNLSGGNQQKACLAKWLCRKPRVIILDEPTRGIDVGAKTEIHSIINDLCRQGIAVIMISSELPEILGSSDRIVVLYEGRKMCEFEDARDVSQEMIMTAASGESRI